MDRLDFKSPFDELSELREIFTAQQIAELTGLRRETISRARPDSRFHRRTEKALADLYAVTSRMKAGGSGDLGQLAAVLRRCQPLLDNRSIAELLAEGKADAVLELLDSPAPSEAQQLESIKFDATIEAEMKALEEMDEEDSISGEPTAEQQVRDLIAADSALAAHLPALEARIREWFGADVTIRRTVAVDHALPDAQERVYLRLRSNRPFDEELDRLTEFFEREESLIAPFEDRLIIGNI